MQETSRGRKKAIVITVLLHVVLVLSLILGIEFSDYRPLSGPQVDIIQAEIVTPPAKPEPPPVDPAIERVQREQEAEEARKAMLEKQRQNEAEQKAAQEREAERRAEREKAEAERKRKTEADALAAKRKAEEAEKKKKAAEEEAKRKAAAEAEAKRKAAAEAEAKRKAQAEQAAREKALQDALAQEERERELDPLRDAYSAAIAQQIARNWLKPPGIGEELRCEVLAMQTPDGNITDARITRSSGNAVFDESVIKAIYKAAPLPQPPRPEIFERELEIGFCSTGKLC